MKRILIIEDDEAFRSTLLRMLESGGFQATGAEHGGEALKLLGEDHFDLVLTDVLMPQVDGMEIMTALRRSRSRAPVIAMSGGGRIGAQSYLVMAKSLGAAAVLEKPFGWGELKSEIERVLAEWVR